MPICPVLLSGNEHIWQVTFQTIATGELDFEKNDVLFVLWENPCLWIYRILKENIWHGFWYQRSISRHLGLSSFKNGGKIGAVLVCIQESAQTFTNYLRTTFVLVLIDGLASWYMIHVLLSVPQFESSRIEWCMPAKNLNCSRRNKNTSSKVHTETLCNFHWIF